MIYKKKFNELNVNDLLYIFKDNVMLIFKILNISIKQGRSISMLIENNTTSFINLPYIVYNKSYYENEDGEFISTNIIDMKNKIKKETLRYKMIISQLNHYIDQLNNNILLDNESTS